MRITFHKRFKIFTVCMAISILCLGCVESKVDTASTATKAREILSNELKSGNQKTRETIVRLTGGMIESEAKPLLDMATKDMQPSVVKKALEKIYEKKNADFIQVVKNNLGDKFDPDVIKVLIDMGATDIDANIEKGLTSVRPIDRSRALELYSAYKGEDGKERIRTFIEDKDPMVQMRAKIELVRHGEKDFLPELVALLDNKENIENIAVVNLIGELDLKDYRDKLETIAKDELGIKSVEATRILYRWDDPAGFELVQSRFADGLAIIEYPLLKMVEEKKDKAMIDILRKVMASTNPNERYSAARVVVAIDPEGSDDVIEFILKGMSSDDPNVRDQVAVALSQLPGIPSVKDTLESVGLKDSVPKVVQSVIIALGKVGDSRSIKHLLPFLENSDLETRTTAAAAIINIINREKLPGYLEDTVKKDEEKSE